MIESNLDRFGFSRSWRVLNDNYDRFYVSVDGALLCITICDVPVVVGFF